MPVQHWAFFLRVKVKTRWNSKRSYVSKRLHGNSLAELVNLGERVAELYGGEHLAPVLSGIGPHGIDGELKQLIFAANGPKPRIVLLDAINNVIEIVENADYCVVYDRPLGADGLAWGELTDWWAAKTGGDASEHETRKRLYRRLLESLSNDSPPERTLFNAYKSRYRREFGGRVPVLLPQVYLHCDPYTIRELAVGPGKTLARQRMDFLLLLPNNTRIVIEVDGKQHYATGTRASPEKYSEMVREDRRLHLDGYEVYRFGAEELLREDGAKRADDFFSALLERHEIKP
jgi:very-short-patch-repair endonuclease